MPSHAGAPPLSSPASSHFALTCDVAIFTAAAVLHGRTHKRFEWVDVTGGWQGHDARWYLKKMERLKNWRQAKGDGIAGHVGIPQEAGHYL